ncbi:MAG: type II toxin-antitoxin system RelE/ParE family toxin [Desulfobaccales bacterium]
MPKRVAGATRPTILYRGSFYTVELALTLNGSCPAREFLNGLTAEKRAKILALIRRLADQGRINDREKFKKIEGTEFFEFKDFQTRMPCFFQPGGRLIITHGFIKKKDKIPASELEKARSIRAEYNQRF